MGEQTSVDSSADKRRRFTWRWRRVIIALVVFGAGFFAFQAIDLSLGRWSMRVEKLKEDGFKDQVLEGFKNFPQPLTIAVTCILIGLLDKRPKRIIIAILVAQLGANLTYNGIKRTVRRDRPYVAVHRLVDSQETRADDTWRGIQPGNTSRDYQSFPSGHSAAAFAFAGVLAWYYPRAAIVFGFLAIGAATSRVLHLAHWPSDCMAGAFIGYLWSLVGLRIVRE